MSREADCKMKKMKQDGETVVAFVNGGASRKVRDIWNDREGTVSTDEITIGDHRPRGICHFNSQVSQNSQKIEHVQNAWSAFSFQHGVGIRRELNGPMTVIVADVRLALGRRQ